MKPFVSPLDGLLARSDAAYVLSHGQGPSQCANPTVRLLIVARGPLAQRLLEAEAAAEAQRRERTK